MIPFDLPAFAWRMVGMAVVVGSALGLSYCKGHNDGFTELQLDWDKQQLRQANEYAENLKAINADLEAMRAAERAKDVKYENGILAISHQRDAALAGLRNRPERSAVPAAGKTAAAGEGCTGAYLFRDDAAFLVGEASRADELRAALERCQGGDAEPVVEGGRGDR